MELVERMEMFMAYRDLLREIQQLESTVIGIEPEEKPIETKETKAEPKKAAGKKPAPVDKGKIIALHNAGWDAAKIADEMKCTKQTVYNVVSLGRAEGKVVDGKSKA